MSDAKGLFEHSQMMASQKYSSPLSSQFQQDIETFYSLYDSWQQKQLSLGEAISCTAGCAHCCGHWVEDVYHFEVARIAELIAHELPAQLVKHLIDVCRQDEEELIEIVEESGSDDEITLLNLFFQKRRKCPLLMEDNRCAVYDMRPLTCRSFYSRKAPVFCTPEHTYDTDQATFTVQPHEPIEDLLDEIDVLFVNESGPTGLRSQLWRELEKYQK